MVTKTKKHGCKPARPLSDQEREKLRQTVLEWHNSTVSTLNRLAEIAGEMLDELSNCYSPLHEFFSQPEDLRGFIADVHNAESSLTFVMTRVPLCDTSCVPNPCDLLSRDE
jgi:hypothetical protein